MNVEAISTPATALSDWAIVEKSNLEVWDIHLSHRCRSLIGFDVAQPANQIQVARESEEIDNSWVACLAALPNRVLRSAPIALNADLPDCLLSTVFVAASQLILIVLTAH